MWQMRQAQGHQQNDISRYLNNMGEQLRDMNDTVSHELKDVLSQLGMLRSDLRRERVHGNVLPDGTVQLSSGEIVDGVRGAPAPGHSGVSAVSPSASHVQGYVRPDGTVMVGDKVVEGVRGSPRPATAAEAAEEAKLVKESALERHLEEIVSKRELRECLR